MTNTEKLIEDLSTSIKYQKELQEQLYKQRESNGSFSILELDVLKNSYISEAAMFGARLELRKSLLPEYLKEEV